MYSLDPLKIEQYSLRRLPEGNENSEFNITKCLCVYNNGLEYIYIYRYETSKVQQRYILLLEKIKKHLD